MGTPDPGPLTSVRTVCSYCGVGCGMVLDLEPGPDGATRIRKVRGDADHPANAGRLCTKGAHSAEMLVADGRLRTALRRPERGAQAEPTPVDAAITDTARRLREILDEHGPDALSLYVSGQMTLEAQYLATKLAKGFWRTRWIESNSRLCMASAGTGYKQSLGSDGPPGSYADLDHADVFLVVGANMADCHPILFLRMMDRVKQGAKLIVVDPRRTATAAKADLFLQLEPGTDLALLNGLLHLLVEQGAVDEEFVAGFTEGWEAMPEFLADYGPEAVASITGVPEDDLREAARLIGGAANWTSCWTMGLNQSTHGTWNTNALVNLHLATGAICRTGSGPFSLTGQPNAMGGREMGYMGPGLPGQRAVLSADDRRFVEELWAVPEGTIRADVGTGTIDMFARMAEGEIKACWIVCTNPVASVANRGTVVDALERCDFVVTQDVFEATETNAYADVVLPAAMWAEVEGVMINSERNLTLLQPAVTPPGEALPDWQIIARVACEMGYAEHFTYSSAEEVFEELKRAWNPATGYDVRGVSYARLRGTPVQWPAAPDGPDRNPVRYLNDGISRRRRPENGRLSFATPSGRAQFLPRPHMPQAELPDDEHPLVLTTGRLQHQWHTLTRTGKVPALTRLNPGPFVEIHPADAEAAGIADGDRVAVASRRGRAVLPAVVTDRMRPGTCWAPFHWSDLFGEDLAVNAVTNDAVDPASLQPELKACAVALERVAPAELPASADEGPREVGAVFGLDLTPPVLTGAERRYLAGFLAGVDRGGAPGVPVLPAGAPVGTDTAAWINGMLAGTFSRLAASEPKEPGVGGRRPLLVLWASQTGNAEAVASSVAARLDAVGRTPQLVCMGDTCPDALPPNADLLVVTSTFGDGDSPDVGADFWADLAADRPPLRDVRFAVLALGDPSYSEFCGHGRRVDERLAELGGTRLLDRVDCDPDFEAPADAWTGQVVALLTSDDGATRAPATTRPVAPPAPAAEPTPAPVPVDAVLRETRLLSLPGSAKEIRRFTLAGDGGFAYEAGDALSVRPVNHPDLVEEWLELTGLPADDAVTVRGEDMAFAEALGRHLDITRISPALLGFVAERTGDRVLKELLRAGHGTDLARWTWDRQAPDVLTEFPVRAPAQEWADTLTALQPRWYSISSSPLTSPDAVSLTVSVVRFTSRHGRGRRGVCSTFLADAAGEGPTPVLVRSSPRFRPPADPATPMVMVGPGTGVAPFVGFLEDRRARGHTAPNWLFFGEQRCATDFYYREELEGMRADGTLARLDVAFSRDQRHKVYVQDRMREHGAQLWRWLADGAHFYVCGDAGRMAKDVDLALRDVVAAHGGMDADRTAAYVKQLVADGRYVRDVY
ncbi:bifunctional nitrate reductase/sulfite reductase flavoprotein subunit alpha [Pseudonocardia sp. RS11V-5]|uniref:bifunctional nitrate reductase/sulfite reductase flavoprotein subunit alpha n=1 Tax=Pseudonocardia terrae TaxID=2905831 RepID=UPI001E387AD3|nr:bifunctional nitrate reductase/sulfite reductase flavoprotein subunit alpha [Pseudonocardia terrae]MCE3553752.1 bifunctional nitrate reductase/sulfite reductase flavoprotein subunit alpha [Pseudonocardia terrae]